MIDLNCPRCEANLQIDDGFRGGVCRCYSCGTLLTVPSDPASERAESLKRPERPDQPAGAADASGGSGVDRPELPTGAGGASKGVEADAAGDGASDAAAAGGGAGQVAGQQVAGEGTVYETSSGRKVQLSERELSGVPIAQRRRMAIRASTVATVCLVLLALIGGVVYGVVAVFSGQGEADPDQVHRDVFGITENPFLMTEPSFMGLPMAGRTVLIVDGSGPMRQYFGQMKRAVEHAIGTLQPSHEVQVILGSESGLTVYPKSPKPAGELEASTLTQRMEAAYAGGGVSIGPAIERAVAGGPDRIMVVGRQAPGTEELEAIGKTVEEAGTVLVAVLFDRESPELKRIAEASGGTLITLSGGRFQRWYRDYLRQQRSGGDESSDSGEAS